MKTMYLLVVTLIVTNVYAINYETSSNAVIKTEFIYLQNEVAFPSCHASTIVETSEGLVAAWFGGTNERHPDVGIWLSRNIEGKWTTPVEAANGIQHSGLRYPT